MLSVHEISKRQWSMVLFSKQFDFGAVGNFFQKCKVWMEKLRGGDQAFVFFF